MKTVYVCDDSITGIFSAIYDAWKAREQEGTCKIVVRTSVEQELFCEYAEVEATESKASAVIKLIEKHMGMEVYGDIYYAALSQQGERGTAILNAMLAARTLKDSRRIMEHLTHPAVEEVFELRRNVTNEAHFLKEVIRFRELGNGVLYSEIDPKNQVLTCIAPHFANRLPLENWMIHDKTHQTFAVHEAKKQWVLIEGEELNIQKVTAISEREREYARLWKEFFRTISIEARENKKCQQNHLPLRYRPNMVEFSS